MGNSIRCNRCLKGLPVFEGRFYSDDHKLYNRYICSECGNVDLQYVDPHDRHFDIEHPMVAKTMHLTEAWYRRVFGRES